ncbi:MAG: hypothetical protein PHX83_00630 [Acidobacteriia bacterium]|nr:hypothetical protein [Terriglobia bacterium]
MRFKIFNRIIVSSALLIFSLGFSVPTWASPLHTTISIDTSVVNGTQLKAGTYDFALKGDQLVVRRDDDGKLMVKVPVKVEQTPTKSADSRVILVNNDVTEIHFANKKEYLVLE